MIKIPRGNKPREKNFQQLNFKGFVSLLVTPTVFMKTTELQKPEQRITIHITADGRQRVWEEAPRNTILPVTYLLQLDSITHIFLEQALTGDWGGHFAFKSQHGTYVIKIIKIGKMLILYNFLCEVATETNHYGSHIIFPLTFIVCATCIQAQSKNSAWRNTEKAVPCFKPTWSTKK